MQRSQALTIVLLSAVICVTSCAAAPEQPYSHEAWAESQHPPSDMGPLPAGCKAVRYDGGFIPIKQTVTPSGQHCVVHDFVQRRKIDVITRSKTGSPGCDGILSFYEGSNVDLDLRGHLVSGVPFDDTVGILANDKYTDLRVHDGKVVTPGSSGIGVFLARYQAPPQRQPKYMAPEDLPPMRSKNYDVKTKAFLYSDPWDYQPPTHYTAENLTIQSGGRGIIMSGADNVIRNNIIEVDGKVAVYMYGPRPVIEGNTFIVKLDANDKATLPAMLKLRDADGAIIRNNRFIVKSGPFGTRQAEAAINLLASKNVLIENNIVQDTRQLVRKDEASTTLERGNQLK